MSCESCKLIKNMDSVSLRCSPLSSQDCHKPRCLLCRVEPSHRHLFLLFRAPNSRVHLHSNSAVYNREYTTHKGDNTGLPPSSGIFIISHHILKPICNHSFNILFKYHTNTDIILALIPYDNHFSITVKSLFTTLDISDMVTDKVSDIYCRQPTSHKTITYWFSSVFLSDILPTCLRHLHRHYRHYYRQKEICTDILHRQNCINLQRSQTSS